MIKRVLLATAIGVLITLSLFAASFVADSAELFVLARGLFWQNSLLQGLIPPVNIGTAAQPFHEGTPLTFLAFIASFPLGIILYGLVSYALISLRMRRIEMLESVIRRRHNTP